MVTSDGATGGKTKVTLDAAVNAIDTEVLWSRKAVSILVRRENMR